MPHLAVSRIAKSYDGNPAVRDISFEVAAGRVLALCGENGAGKSTLMKMLSGATRPDSGEILLDGKAVAIASPSDAMALGIRTVYQELSRCCRISASPRTCCSGACRRAGFPSSSTGPRRTASPRACLPISASPRSIPAALVGSLSVARQQIVEIAKALVAEPKILILDEPTAVISAAEAAKLFDKVRSLAAAGTTVLYISHRLEEIYAIADEIVVLKDGRSVLSGAGRRTRPGTPDPRHGRPAAFGDLPGAKGRGRQAGAGGREAVARRHLRRCQLHRARRRDRRHVRPGRQRPHRDRQGDFRRNACRRRRGAAERRRRRFRARRRRQCAPTSPC